MGMYLKSLPGYVLVVIGQSRFRMDITFLESTELTQQNPPTGLEMDTPGNTQVEELITQNSPTVISQHVSTCTPKNNDQTLKTATDNIKKKHKTTKSSREKENPKRLKLNDELNGSYIDNHNETILDDGEDYLFQENGQELVGRLEQEKMEHDITQHKMEQDIASSSHMNSNLNQKITSLSETMLREAVFESSANSDILGTGFVVPNADSQEAITVYSIIHKDHCYNFRMLCKLGRVTKVVISIKDNQDNKLEIDIRDFEIFTTLIGRFQKNYTVPYISKDGLKISYTVQNQLLIEKKVRDKIVNIVIPKYDFINFFNTVSKASQFCAFLVYIKNEQINTLTAFADKLITDVRFSDNISLEMVKIRLINYYNNLTSESKYKLPYRFIISEFLNKL